MSGRQIIADEETPLLWSNGSNEYDDVKPKETPIPWRQFSIIIFLQLVEPLASQMIYPFIPELIRDLGITDGDDSKVGYYAGLLQSVFFASQAVAILYWGRLSDVIGRKPVILCGLFGLSISMYCFGLSQTYWGVILSRCMSGAMNGTVGVMKSILGELTDPTNAARAFAYQPLARSMGGSSGALIGGSLSHPADKFASFRESGFFRAYPYFLPCAVPATFALIAWFITLRLFEETQPCKFSFITSMGHAKNRLFSSLQGKIASPGISVTDHDAPETLETKLIEEDDHLPLLMLLTPRVVVVASNYALLSLVEFSFRAIQPVFYAMPIALGGLGLTPETIGYCLATRGICNGLFQILFFADMQHRMGTKPLYLIGVCSGFVAFGLLPVMSVLAKAYGVGMAVWVAISLQIASTNLLNVCYGCAFLYATAAAPNRRSLGATHGIMQMMASIARAIGPSVVNSLFSLSIEHGYLGGWMVHYVMLVVVAMSVVGGMMLPHEIWQQAD